MSEATISAQTLITNPTGLHARPCIKLTKIAKTSPADIEGRIARKNTYSVLLPAPIPVYLTRTHLPAALDI